MAKTRAQLKEIDDERRFWEGIGKRLGLGTLIGWTFKRSATFSKDGLCLSVEGGVFVVLNELDIRIAELEAERDEWRSVFGHLGATPDDAGNAIVAARQGLEAKVERLRGLLRTCDGSHVASEEWRMAVAAALEPAGAGEDEDA